MLKLAFRDADTNTDTETDILAEFRAKIVHKLDTHEDPRRLVRHAAIFLARILTKMSVRDARVYSCTVHDKLLCTRLQNYTIGESLMSVSVSV